MIEMEAVTTFLTTHARLLDRRRCALQMRREAAAGTAAPIETAAPSEMAAPSETTAPIETAETTELAAAALSALAAYRNADGGYGSALEPDLRSPESQPVAALHAFELFEEACEAGVTSRDARGLCDWLGRTTLGDGGLPFALPLAEHTGSAPFWAMVDPNASNLHMTAMLAGIAHRVGRYDAGVRDHPWLAQATAYTWRGIEAMTEPGHALEYRFVLQFLDALCDDGPRAVKELERLGACLPASGRMAVAGGLEDEAMRPLDFAPLPNRPIRALLGPEVVAADLDRVAGEQQDDGGWVVDFASHSPMGALEWRGHATVQAVRLLRANGRL